MPGRLPGQETNAGQIQGAAPDFRGRMQFELRGGSGRFAAMHHRQRPGRRRRVVTQLDRLASQTLTASAQRRLGANRARFHRQVNCTDVATPVRCISNVIVAAPRKSVAQMNLWCRALPNTAKYLNSPA